MDELVDRDCTIVRVRAHSGLILELLLSTGELLYADIGRHLAEDTGKDLASNPQVFAKASLVDGVVAWPTGAQVDCDAILSSLAPAARDSAMSTMSDGRLEPLASRIALTNLDYFLPHFTFPITKFAVQPGLARELADHLVLVKGRGILFQLKQRQGKTTGSLDAWFKNKILKKAKNQIRDSRELLKNCPEVPAKNSLGMPIVIHSAEVKRLHNVISYQTDNDSGGGEGFDRWIISRSAGFIHVFPIQEYERILGTLVTLSELLEYLAFRQMIIERWHDEGKIPSESALLGQFIAGDDASPLEDYAEVLKRLDENRDEFDLSFFLQDYERSMPDYDPCKNDFLEILAEFALLNRSELRETRARLLRCVAFSDSDQSGFRCDRMITENGAETGFLFVGFGLRERRDVEQAFQNLAFACKYESKVGRQIAVGVWKRASAFNFRWCMVDGPWVESPELDMRLKESNPFKGLKSRTFSRYRLKQSQQRGH